MGKSHAIAWHFQMLDEIHVSLYPMQMCVCSKMNLQSYLHLWAFMDKTLHLLLFGWVVSSTKWCRLPVNCLYVSINYKLSPVNCKKKKENHPHLMLSTVEACIMWWLKEPIGWQCFNQNLHYLLLIWVTKLAINQLKKMLSLLSGPLAVSSLRFFFSL